MGRKEFLDKLFKEVQATYAMDLSRDRQGIQFASEMIRKKKTIEEATSILAEKFNLIKILPNEP